MRHARWFAAFGVVAGVAVGVTAYVIACGPFTTMLNPRQTTSPVDPEAYRRGELGLVRPTFGVRYLIDAYRVLNGLPAQAAPATPGAISARRPIEEWHDAQEKAAAAFTPPLSSAPFIDPDRRTRDYGSFPNCLDDAFSAALGTLRARIATYGPTSREVGDWMTAQTTVFKNCTDGDVVLPAAAPSWADASLIADRAYQTAAAYFYATQYEEAARRFRAIGDDAQSMWRPMGKYLAARAMIRAATVPSESTAQSPIWRERLETAQADLQSVLNDPASSSVHASAQGLLDFIAVKLRPAERLREVSQRLATSASVRQQDVDDFVWLIRRSDAAPPGDALSGWIRGMREGGEVPILRWSETKSNPWLVAALWSTPPQHEQVAALLGAAEDVPSTSPIYPMVSFLRVRLLMRRGDSTEARNLVATLPTVSGGPLTPEILNLIRAERFALAATLDELLDNASRSIVSKSSDDDTDLVAADPAKDTSPVFDEDAGVTFTLRLPLDRLVEAAESSRLPPRLRRRVAEAAFARAVVLRRQQAGLRLVQVLWTLAPPLRPDLERYRAATTDDQRHRAGILLLLRTPGLHIHVVGVEDEPFINANLSPRRFDHVYKDNWWCGLPESSATIPELYDAQPIPSPSFLGAGERMTLNSELNTLRQAGSAEAYLTSEALAWARAVPTDVNAAEALAQAIEGWRWSYCDRGNTPSDLPRQAFQTLHRLFPKSPAAARTKYWYR